MSTPLQPVPADLAAQGQTEKMQTIRAAVESLPDAQKQAFAQELSARFPAPDQTTSNKVWLIIIWAFVSVMVLSVGTLCITVFVAPAAGGTAPDKILTVFTTVTAFLAGLFAPSPMTGANQT
jgi:hypothetical protein